MKHESTAVYLTDKELVAIAVAINYFQVTVSDENKKNLKIGTALDTAIDKIAALTDKIVDLET